MVECVYSTSTVLHFSALITLPRAMRVMLLGHVQDTSHPGVQFPRFFACVEALRALILLAGTFNLLNVLT